MKIQLLRVGLVLPLLAGCAHSPETKSAQEPTRYQHALFSPGQKFGLLPPAVQNTVRAEAGTTEIVDIQKDTEGTEPIYIVYFRKSAIFPPLYIAQDGSVLNPDRTVAVSAYRENLTGATTGAGSGLKLADLPAEVSRRIQEHSPNAEIAQITKDTWGDRTVYVVTFKDDARYPKLHIAADGTVLSERPK